LFSKIPLPMLVKNTLSIKAVSIPNAEAKCTGDIREEDTLAELASNYKIVNT